MAYLTERQVLARAERATRAGSRTVAQLLSETVAPEPDTFDVFLSHSSAESKRILLGIFSMLKDRGLSVYVDKYTDPHLKPDDVTAKTAKILRKRMHQSNVLLYVHSRHSQQSRWMPWELGFFDGLKGKVGVIPVTQDQEEDFKGEEYLSLYPYVDIATLEGSNNQTFRINRSPNTYARLDDWTRGVEKIRMRYPRL